MKEKIEKSNEIRSQRLDINITKFKALEQILRKPKMFIRLILAVFVLSVVLFAGIAIVILALKHFYPYSEITTNVMGATTIKNEDKTVSYWLFNTAELWADSGIKVKKGQTITVRASGKKHTAIHHLVKDTYSNSPKLSDPWVGSEGFMKAWEFKSPKDSYRAKYRIAKNNLQDALLMLIAPRDYPFKQVGYRPVDNQGFFVIGKQSEEIHVPVDGVLYFSVNDVVLDDETIAQMILEVKNGTECDNHDEINALKDSLSQFREKWDKIDTLSKYYDGFLDIIKNKAEFSSRWSDTSMSNKYSYGSCGKDSKGMDMIELYGYFMNEYKTAWFDDNVGSFLIIVETSNE